MPTTPCPSCGLPRADELLAAVPCPLCGADGLPATRDVPALVPEPPPVVEAPAPVVATSSRFGIGLALGLLIGAAAGAGGVLGWQARPSPTADPEAVAAAAPAEPPPLPPSPAPKPPPPQPAVAVPTAKEKANPFRPTGPVPMVLDNPDGETRPVVRPGGHLVLGGKVKRLLVTGLKGGAVLDASQLDAAEVVVIGPIDGGSRLVARAPSGVVYVRGAVDGGSVVELTGKTVRLEEPVGGANTRVRVTLTSGGELAFVAVGGAARLEYRRANSADPAVRLSPGAVTPPAVVVEVP